MGCNESEVGGGRGGEEGGHCGEGRKEGKEDMEGSKEIKSK